MVNPIQPGGAGPNEPASETTDEKRLVEDLGWVYQRAELFDHSACTSKEDLEYAKTVFEKAVQNVINDYTKSKEKGHKKPDIGPMYTDFLNKQLMAPGSGPDHTALITETEGHYTFNEGPVNGLTLKDLQPDQKGYIWSENLRQLLGKILP